MKILVYAYRDWSFLNVEPALRGFEYIRWYEELGWRPCFSDYDLILTCEPHIDGWMNTFPKVRGKVPILAMQQNIYWSDTVNPKASWMFDKYLVYGKMHRDMCIAHGVPGHKICITGNPRFDRYFKMQTEDKGYILVLCGGFENKRTFRDIGIFKNVVYRLHPLENKHQLEDGFDELVRCASKVVFRSTGIGIVPMILNKPVMIYSMGSSKKDLRYKPSKLYGKHFFGTDPKYIEYAVGSCGAIERVRDEIQRFSGSSGD